MDFLATLAYGLLESGQTAGQTEPVIRDVGKALGMRNLGFNSFGRILLIDTTRSDGSTTSVSGAARSLELIDCTRSRELSAVAAELLEAGRAQETSGDFVADDRVKAARAQVERLRQGGTPWWIVTLGTTLLAFCISMQVGVTWQAWVSAAMVQFAASLVGAGAGRGGMPTLFAIALQGCVSGALATFLVQVGFVDPVGAAAAIAVTWLLLVPLPQIIGAVADAIDADYVSAVTRVASVVVAAIAIIVAGAFTFALGELLGMEHPRLDELPAFPWYLVLVFSGLGAIANALANGGRFALVLPAAGLGILTATVSQMLLNVAQLPALWASSLAAVVLGSVTAMLARGIGYPQQVLALMGITGALLPGIPVFFGILQEMGGGHGIGSFVEAAAICVGIAVGSGLGAYLIGFRRYFRPRPVSHHRSA